MSNCYIDNHPLVRDGRSQDDRVVANLQPESVQIDDRTMQDMLEFLSRYAQQVIYHDVNGAKGDWTPFFENIIPVQIALISKFDIKSVQEKYTKQSEKTLHYPEPDNINLLLDQISLLFREINRWQAKLKNDDSLGRVLRDLIKSDLRYTLREFIICIQTAGAESISNYKPKETFFKYQTDWNLSIQDFMATNRSLMRDRNDWEKKGNSLIDKLDLSVCAPLEKQKERAKRLALKNKLDEIFQTLYKALEEIVGAAPQFLAQSLTATQSNPPHFALLIAFLRLFKNVQVDLNTITKRHLDFFYRDVLQLKEKEAIPDKAHLVFELAKKVEPPKKLEKNTLFKDGKDANQAEIQFGLDQELILDKAQVGSLRTLFFEKENEIIKNIYIAPIANSADGQGGAFTTQEVKSWPTVGSLQNGKKAKLGIAFASEVLLLKEGKRTITLTLDCSGSDFSKLNAENSNELASTIFTACLSGEKEWIKKEPSKISIEKESATICITIKLGAEDPPVTIYDAETLNAAPLKMNRPLPVLKLEFDPEASAETHFYHHLRSIKIKSVTIQVKVCGVRDVVVQNDNAVQDANSAFMPFGAQPRAGSNFYIGSNEIFLKNWSEVRLNLEWDKDPCLIGPETEDIVDTIYNNYPFNREFQNYKVGINLLENGSWNGLKLEKDLFVDNPASEDSKLQNCNDNDLKHITLNSRNNEETETSIGIIPPENQPFTNDSTSGFLRLELKEYLKPVTNGNSQENNDQIYNAPSDPFLIDEYPKAIIRSAMSGDPDKIPSQPYIPVIKTFSLDYSACAVLNDSNVFHLYPYEKTYKAETFPGVSVLPDFRPVVDGESIFNEGNLFIGLENLRPGGQLSLLFQVAEDTANPDQEEAEVAWWYLASNEWKPLRPDSDVLEDTTNGLVTSGVIRFAIPWEINKENTLLPPDWHWLRVTTSSRSDAIAETIAVHAQAAQATFRPRQENDLQRLLKPLEEGNIKKPVTNIGFLKGLEQPYPSFGGRPKESASQFYIRVSEHLRHKGRAITIFDYERLVLEQFPGIYKVKCITHTIGRRAEENSHTLAPGFVTVIVVPDLSELTAANRLSPKVSLGMLKRVEDYLKNLSSPFAHINVLNPKYEQVSVEFEVKFKAGKSEAFYREELKKSIQLFLTPWISEGEDRLVFGGTIYKSTIINHIESQSYVEYLTDFKMNGEGQEAADEISGLTARSVLNAGSININLIKESIQQNPFEQFAELEIDKESVKIGEGKIGGG